ncbi:MAG: hypothetical protein LBQ79_04945 [Deltaproteobacteria bacterium]|nr:hypothetical protein [Deltaproteobacteria bacterium]
MTAPSHPNPKSFRDYRDYFVVDGRHVGDYEGMYRDCADPWRIEELGLRLDMRAALLLLEAFLPAAGPEGALRVLDAGAGAGLFSLALSEALRPVFPKVELTLSDISPTALARALARFRAAGAPLPAVIAYDLRMLAGGPAGGVCHGPGGSPGAGPGTVPGTGTPRPGGEPGADVSAVSAGVPVTPVSGALQAPQVSGAPQAPQVSGGLQPPKVSGGLQAPPVSGALQAPQVSGGMPPASPFPLPSGASPPASRVPFAPGSFDLIVLAQTLWGIVLELPGVLAGFRHMLPSGGRLLVSQHFPGERNQEWGREVTGPEDFSRILAAEGFTLLSELETDRASNHHWGSMWRKG